MGMRDRGGCTKVSPLSLVMLGGRPAGSACSKTAVSPARAELYMRVAKAITSGDSGVGWIVWSPGGGLAIVTIVRILGKSEMSVRAKKNKGSVSSGTRR